MKRIIATSATACAAVLAGAFFLGYSPPTCACADAVTVLALDAGYKGLPRGALPSPADLEASMNTHMVGSAIVYGEYPYSAENRCTQSSPQNIVCKVYAGTFMFVPHGYKVTYHVQNGRLQHATVDRTYGEWP